MSELSARLFDMNGRTVLVTGGGRGLGRDFALAVAEAGAQVLIGSRRVENCEKVVAEIEAFGGTATAFPLDVADLASIDAFLADADQRGFVIDTLVNNAGVSWGAKLFDYPMSGWDKVFAINVRGMFYLTQKLTQRMAERKQGGIVINVGSIAGTGGAPDKDAGQPAYVASKAAVHALTKDLAIKLAPHGIRVNALAPGPFLTDMFNWVKHHEGYEEIMGAAVPIGYTGQPDDIKATALYMCSNACRFMTGHTLFLDGGMTALLANA